MTNERREAAAEFWRMMRWIGLAAVLMVVAAIVYLALTGDVTVNMVIATVFGVFFSVLLGCGLFAAAFFSAKSGHDQEINDATRQQHRDE
jgi:hypothetical protein